MSLAQQGMEESSAQSDPWHAENVSFDVPVADIEFFGTAGASFGERRQWFDDHPDLRSWFPGRIDDATWEQLQAFTGWFDIVERNSSEVIYPIDQESPSMLWLWCNTEHLTKECVFKVLCEGAQVFYQKWLGALSTIQNCTLKEQKMLIRQCLSLWGSFRGQ